MSASTIQTSFISGELSPSFFGRVDKAQYKNGASTMRNFQVNYRGGAMSRAGFEYIGMCKQDAPNAGGTATSNPPRDINFQLSINTGFALEFGDQYMRVKFQGAYVTESGQTVTGITQANPGIITSNSHGFSNGDWVFGSNIGGMTNFNGLTWIVQNATTNTFTLTSLFGTAVNTTSFSAFTSGGTFSRIYTAVSPYAAIDLPYLKFTQSANIMNLACVNQVTGTEYPPYNLQRVTNTNWTFTAVSFSVAINPPLTVSSKAISSTTPVQWYSYGVTAIDATGNESVMSTATDVYNNDIAINAGSNTITWSAVTSTVAATQYNIYSATSIYTGASAADPGFVGAQYGFLGSSFGLYFTDTNILADFTKTPPIHNNPFARGTIDNVITKVTGSSYSQATINYTINTSTGSGFQGTPIVNGTGGLGGFLINYGGQNYATTDVMTITGSVGGTTATVTLVVGPQTGTYPGTVQYFDQRLVYADSINAPDTYQMSQPGLYSNFDYSIPVVDSDAITGTPWGVQINGIQFMVPTINGLLTFTGNGVWLISGGSSAGITPSNQTAQAQAQVGCSALVPPLFIGLHVLYVQAKNSIVRDVAFNFLYNVFTGDDITIFSNHLFSGFTLQQWAWAQEPFKTVWSVRNDGILLSLAYIKEQEIQGWSRHDTNGLFVGVCVVIEGAGQDENTSDAIEPPTDDIYVIVQRYIVGHGVWVYYSERQNNRIWQNIEDTFCVDSGLRNSLIFPNAVLTPSAAFGTNNITSTIIVNGGKGYTNPQASAVDSTGSGTGVTFSVTQSGGIITAITPISNGNGYTAGFTQIIITDPTGTGAIAGPVITNYVAFNASASVFTANMIGNVIRVGGGKATIVTYNSGTSVVANITQVITNTVPNDPNFLPIPAIANTWSIGPVISTITGLNHLEGMTVSILADGGVQPQQVVVNGSIALQQAASVIVIGLPYTCQLQTMYLDIAEQSTSQGKRKNVASNIIRLEQSRGVQLGVNQPDQSTQPNFATVPWVNMQYYKDRSNLVTAGTAEPLFTGDTLPIYPTGDWNPRGQVAMQIIDPVPATVLSVVTSYTIGDT